MCTNKRLALLATASAVSASSSIYAPAGFKPGAGWQICIHQPIKHDSASDFLPENATIFDIDLGHAQDYPEMIPNLHGAGKTVICYFNGGAVQDWDEDKDDFPKDVVGKSLDPPYTDEFYVDIRDSRVVDIMKKLLDAAVDAGCDAVDPDNVDAWVQDGEDRTGFGLTAEDYTAFLASLAEYAHSIETTLGQPLFVGQKNAPAIAPSLVSVLDFAVLESCREWGFCGQFQRYIDAGKPVFQIEYPPSIEETGSINDEDYEFYCNEPASAHGDQSFSKLIKYASARLDGWTQICGGDMFEQPMLD